MGYHKNIICSGCGAEYEVFEHNLGGARDKDSEECDFCKKTLISWNGGAMYTTKLVKQGNTDKPAKD